MGTCHPPNPGIACYLPANINLGGRGKEVGLTGKYPKKDKLKLNGLIKSVVARCFQVHVLPCRDWSRSPYTV